jgi:hypothetical protein
LLEIALGGILQIARFTGGKAMSDSNRRDPLEGIDDSKRRTLMRLALGTAFVTPIVASFSMEGLTISRVHAQAPNGSGIVTPPKKPPG